MIVTNIQLPYGINDSKSSKDTQNQEDFLSTLTEAIMTNSKEKGEIKLENLVLDDAVPKDKEDISYDVISQLGMLMGVISYEHKTTDEIKINIEATDIPIGENIESNNIVIPYIVEDTIDNQIGLLKSEEGLETQHLETEFSLELKEMPNIPKLELQEEKLIPDRSIDRKINLNIKNQSKDDEFLSDTISKVVNKIEEENLKPEENDFRISKDMIFNTYIQENKALEINPEILPDEQILPKENIHNINETIIRLVETTTEGHTSVMKLKLYPEDLGTVNVVLKMDEGKLSTRILVDNDQIKQLFMSKVNEISENLVKQNINMDKLEIELNENFSFNSNSNFDSRESFNRNNREQFRQRPFIRFDSESISKEVMADKYTNSSSISILA